MFYNNNVIDNDNLDWSNVRIGKKFFNFRNILMLILTFIMSIQSFSSLNFNVLPFIMLGVAGVFNLPLIFIFLSGILGMMFNETSGSIYALYTIYFVSFSVITSVLNIEGVSRKYVGLIKMNISFVLTLIVGMIFFNVSLINSIYLVLIATILFPVFVSGIYVMFNINKKFIFSNEEIISMLCVFSFVISLLLPFKIHNLSIMNILAIITIMIFGWKKGCILGTVSGFLIGIIMAITKDLSLTYVITLSFSGMIAGIFSKLGKIPVIIGYIIGFFIVSNLTDSNAFFGTNIIEIFISSFILLLLPKKLSFSLDDLFNINDKLDYNEINYLNVGNDVKNKLNATADVFSDLADITLPITKEDKVETRSVIKKYILNYIYENGIKIDDINENNNFDICIDSICKKLENLEEISINDFNKYFDDKNSKIILNNINDIYSNMKITRLLKKKEEENSNNLSKQYKEVSKVINNIAKNIIINTPFKIDKNIKNIREELKLAGFQVYEDEIVNIKNYIEYTFVTDILTDIDKDRDEIIDIVSNILERPMKVKLLLNISKAEKSKIKLVSMPTFDIDTFVTQDNKMSEIVNGDSYLTLDMGKGKIITALSDGVGSSLEASNSSKNALKMIEKLIKGGFEEDSAISISNLIIKMREDENSFSTLDIMISDLEKGVSDFIKLRCCSYLYSF